MKYKFESRYKTSYKEIESTLEIWASEHDLSGSKYYTESGKPKYNAIANNVLDFVNTTFSYINNHQQRIVEFLQGLGLPIAYSYHDIYEIAYKDGFLKPTDSDNRHQKIADNYWNFMSMRLINIADSKK